MFFFVSCTYPVFFFPNYDLLDTNLYFLDGKETLNGILLKRPIDKPCFSAVEQNNCPVGGLVKGKLDFVGLVIEIVFRSRNILD